MKKTLALLNVFVLGLPLVCGAEPASGTVFRSFDDEKRGKLSRDAARHRETRVASNKTKQPKKSKTPKESKGPKAPSAKSSKGLTPTPSTTPPCSITTTITYNLGISICTLIAGRCVNTCASTATVDMTVSNNWIGDISVLEVSLREEGGSTTADVFNPALVLSPGDSSTTLQDQNRVSYPSCIGANLTYTAIASGETADGVACSGTITEVVVIPAPETPP